MPAFRDLTGQKFGRLTVVGRAPNNKCGQACWYCVCEDSNRTVVSTSDLKSGHTVSCGCWHLRHGHAKRGETSPEYRAWQRMKDRCLNPKHQKYRYWGGRGITICDRWVNGDGVKSGFECFLGDMGPKPEPKDEYELDRIDPDGMYELGNCHWATHREASAHTRGVQHVPM